MVGAVITYCIKRGRERKETVGHEGLFAWDRSFIRNIFWCALGWPLEQTNYLTVRNLYALELWGSQYAKLEYDLYRVIRKIHSVHVTHLGIFSSVSKGTVISVSSTTWHYCLEKMLSGKKPCWELPLDLIIARVHAFLSVTPVADFLKKRTLQSIAFDEGTDHRETMLKSDHVVSHYGLRANRWLLVFFLSVTNVRKLMKRQMALLSDAAVINGGRTGRGLR